MAIHPTAQVDTSAQLGDGVEIGAWSIVGPGVVLEAGVRLASHVLIVRDTTLGLDTTVHPFAVVGGDPQHAGYKGETTRLEVGTRCLIREHATLNRGTPGGGGLTVVGDDCRMWVMTRGSGAPSPSPTTPPWAGIPKSATGCFWAAFAPSTSSAAWGPGR